MVSLLNIDIVCFKKNCLNHIYVDRNNLNNYFDLFISLIMIDIRRFTTKWFQKMQTQRIRHLPNDIFNNTFIIYKLIKIKVMECFSVNCNYCLKLVFLKFAAFAYKQLVWHSDKKLGMSKISFRLIDFVQSIIFNI